MQIPKSVDHPYISPWILLPLRLFLGVTFIYAGIQKFTDPQFFHPDKAGFIGKQMLAFSNGSPIGGFLLHVVVPNAMLFGFMVAYGEIAIGLGVLIGLLFRPAAFFGLLLSLVFFLSVTWRVYPYFYGADIVFVFCWLTLLLNGPLNTGLPTVDEFLALNLLAPDSPEEQRGFAGVVDFILGTTVRPAEEPALLANTVVDTTKGSSQRGSQQRVNQQRNSQQKRLLAEQRAREVRRGFLQGTLLGGGIVFGLGAMILAYRSLFSATTDTTTTSPGQGTTSNSGTGTGASSNGAATTPTAAATQTGSSTAIAQVKDVAANSAATFTIPSTGDPGLLIHLNNGQFVAYDALCTHAGCQVDYDPTQQLITCPCHGAEFDPAKSAAVVAGPAPTPLTGVAISVDSATGAITLH